MKCTFQ